MRGVIWIFFLKTRDCRVKWKLPLKIIKQQKRKATKQNQINWREKQKKIPVVVKEQFRNEMRFFKECSFKILTLGKGSRHRLKKLEVPWIFANCKFQKGKHYTIFLTYPLLGYERGGKKWKKEHKIIPSNKIENRIRIKKKAKKKRWEKNIRFRFYIFSNIHFIGKDSKEYRLEKI